jgi:hypothetical protein
MLSWCSTGDYKITWRPSFDSLLESSENMLEGYSTDHEVESGKLYTLFSALDYPQAYIIPFIKLYYVFISEKLCIQISYLSEACGSKRCS